MGTVSVTKDEIFQVEMSYEELSYIENLLNMVITYSKTTSPTIAHCSIYIGVDYLPAAKKLRQHITKYFKQNKTMNLGNDNCKELNFKMTNGLILKKGGWYEYLDDAEVSLRISDVVVLYFEFYGQKCIAAFDRESAMSDILRFRYSHVKTGDLSSSFDDIISDSDYEECLIAACKEVVNNGLISHE